MLGRERLIGFVATAAPERAKAFYRDVLGLAFVEESPFAIVFSAGGTMLRVQKVADLVPQPFTALGWAVADIAAKVKGLSAMGVTFETYPGLGQDARGIWRTPDGGQVAWFRDPDGNLLSLTEFGGRAA